MITKGVSDIRGVRGLHTRPGPMTESSGLLKLYRLAVEKDGLLKKQAWVRRQQEQTEKRLAEIAAAMQAVRQVVEERNAQGPFSPARSEARRTLVEY